MVEDQATPDEAVARNTAAAVFEQGKNGTDPTIVELSNGLKLRCMPCPPYALRQPAIDIPEPQPPIIHLEDKGVDEPNPDNPDYIKAHLDWQVTVNLAAMDAMLLFGTSAFENGEFKPLIEYLPPNILPPESNGWLENLEAVGLKPDVGSAPKRYLAWLRCYAMTAAVDLAKITGIVAHLSGTTEEDVAAATESFPGDQVRRADSSVAPKPNRTNRRAVHSKRSRARS